MRCAIIVKNMTAEFNPKKIRLIIGLGNPGKAYEHTYHNLGKRFVEMLAIKKFPNENFKKYTRGQFSYIKTEQFTIAYPEVFMNESGNSIKNACDFFSVRTDELLIAHDENDLSFGSWKIDMQKGDAGHNGIKSTIALLGGNNFWRLRLGIQIGEIERKKAGDFVLSPLSKEKGKEIEKVFETIIARYFI